MRGQTESRGSADAPRSTPFSTVLLTQCRRKWAATTFHPKVYCRIGRLISQLLHMERDHEKANPPRGGDAKPRDSLS